MLIKQGERLINARNWNELVKPDQILRDEDTASSTHGKFVCEPLERGYGTTIGNAMRRVLLASLQGAAFVSVKITGVQHEFTTIHGVLEDVTDVVLNIKQVRLRMDTDEPQRLTLRVDSQAPVTAAQIQANPSPRTWCWRWNLKCAWARAMCLPTCTKVWPMKSV